MIGAMNRGRLRLPLILGSGAIASQAGHLLIYQIQYGAAASTVQSQGVHTYFPTLVKTGLGIGALAILGSLLLIGLARLVAMPSVGAAVRTPSYLPLLSSLFTIQLVLFVTQESVEAYLSGSIASATHLLLVAGLGQLPIAAVAALAIKWLAARVEVAVSVLRQAVPLAAHTQGVATLVPSPWAPALRLAMADSCPAVYAKRGPPTKLPQHR